MRVVVVSYEYCRVLYTRLAIYDFASFVRLQVSHVRQSP